MQFSCANTVIQPVPDSDGLFLPGSRISYDHVMTCANVPTINPDLYASDIYLNIGVTLRSCQACVYTITHCGDVSLIPCGLMKVYDPLTWPDPSLLGPWVGLTTRCAQFADAAAYRW